MKYINEYKLYDTETSTLIHTSEIIKYGEGVPRDKYEIYRSVKGNLYILIKKTNIAGKFYLHSILDSPEKMVDFLINQNEIDLCIKLFQEKIEEV